MIQIILSEKDFDYELQALAAVFFPGQKVNVSVEEPLDCRNAFSHDADLFITIDLTYTKISIAVGNGEYQLKDEVNVSGKEDWHKHEDKSAHPYRTYYKNELKRLLFLMLCAYPEEHLPKHIKRAVPVWGTMTGVRPTKIPMNELLKGKSPTEVDNELKHWYCCTDEKRALCLDIAKREAKLLGEIDLENSYSLYIGIPFCPTTCLYCSFPSYPFETFGHLAQDYLGALEKEIAAVAKKCSNRCLTSIYMGGGTPTALTAGQLEHLLSFVRSCFPMEDTYEFTVEAGRPDSITQEKLCVLRKYGVERISVNPQTMQQKTLDYIGRRHRVEQINEAFHMARELGFTNINMDLIIGLPGETVEDFADTLRQIKKMAPDSLTVHSLVVKRASRLRSLLEEKGDFAETEKRRRDEMEKMLCLAEEYTKAEGYKPYYMYRQKNSAGHFGTSGQENIGYAKEGKECLYNILIMEEMQTIVAVGAGASTKVYHPDKKIVSRIENVKSITDYISRIDEMIERKNDIFIRNR